MVQLVSHLHTIRMEYWFDLEYWLVLETLVLLFSQVFVGKAEVLHEEMMKHFECFGKKREEITAR